MKGVSVLNRLRIKFSKGEEVKYISHLDTLRTFERAVRRAEIPIAYSQGFNPRAQISFGLPLSVGVTGEAEYVDFEMEKIVPAEEFGKRLNNNLPKGFKIIHAEYVNTKGSLMAAIRVSSYRVAAANISKIGKDTLNRYINLFMQKEHIIIEKKTKDTLKEIDIRPYIYSMTVIKADENEIQLGMTLAAGSIFNLKPEIVTEKLSTEFKFDLGMLKIHRDGVFGENCTDLMNVNL